MANPLQRFAATQESIGPFALPKIRDVSDRLLKIDPGLQNTVNDIRQCLTLIERRINQMQQAARNQPP